MRKRLVARLLNWVDLHLDAIFLWSMLVSVGLALSEYLLLAVLLAFGDAQQPWCMGVATVYVVVSFILPALILLASVAFYFLFSRK